MDPQDEIAIPLSKAQTVKLIAAGIVMVGCAMSLYIDRASVISTLPWTRSSPEMAAIFPYFTLVAALLFAIGTGFGARKLFDTRPALVFSSAGIIDNASGVAAGFIPWADIAGIGVYQYGRNRALRVNLVDPEKYVARGSPIRRWVNRVNLRMGGSPVYIPATVMPIEFEELVELFSTQLAKYRGDLPQSRR